MIKTVLITALLFQRIIHFVGASRVPHPWTEFKLCGLTQPGFICDPDGLMTSQDLNKLNDYLRHQFRNLEIRHSFNCIYEHKSVVSILLVYNVRDYFPDTRDYSDEKLYQKLGERLRVDLWPYGGCRDNIYVIFGYQPGFKECLEGTLCKHSQFHINVKFSKDGTQVETFRSRPSLPFAFETNMTTKFFKQTTREQRSAFFKGLRDFSKPLLETLKDFVEDVGKINSSFGNDFISFKMETEFDFEFEWHFSGCLTSYQFLFQPIVCAVTRLLALEAY